MTQSEETAYTEGSRMVWLQMLRRCLKELGYEDPEAKASLFAVEREETLQQLRTICRDFGDNDWPENLHLGDVIDKHLSRHLHARKNH
jgi:hypothetical protein